MLSTHCYTRYICDKKQHFSPQAIFSVLHFSEHCLEGKQLPFAQKKKSSQLISFICSPFIRSMSPVRSPSIYSNMSIIVFFCYYSQPAAGGREREPEKAAVRDDPGAAGGVQPAQRRAAQPPLPHQDQGRRAGAEAPRPA